MSRCSSAKARRKLIRSNSRKTHTDHPVYKCQHAAIVNRYPDSAMPVPAIQVCTTSFVGLKMIDIEMYERKR